MMARVAWQAGRDEAAEVWSRLTTTSEAVSAAAPTLRLPGPGALSRAWQTLALQSHIPFLLGSMQVTDGVQVLVLSPVGKMSNPEALLPVCVSFEGADKAPHETCALIAESGGRVPLASANNASWVTASIDTPQGPRLAMAPALLAHALHVAPFMPPSARARLAGAIDATTRKGFIEPADCVAALLAIDFASLRRPGESRAATG